jgi:hypothetical protein
MNEVAETDDTNPITKLEKTREELAVAFEKNDTYERTKKILNDANNWILATSAGTLILILNNYKLFLLTNPDQEHIFQLPEKEYFISSVIIIIIAIIVLGYNKICLIKRDWIMNISIDNLSILRGEILEETEEDRNDIEEYTNERINEINESWRLGHDMIVNRDKTLIAGIVLYLIGVVIYGTYFLWFIINYN